MKKQEIIDILLNNSKDEWLFDKADKVRHECVGDYVHLRALIEFSNICKRNCKYCGLQSANKHVDRYRITKEDILSAVKKAVNLNYKTIVLQSGEDDFYDTDKLCEIIKDIKKYDVALTLSIGEKTFEEYKAYKESGADRYLLRIETTDEELYKEMHPNMSYQNRRRCLEDLKTLNYEVGTGCLIGLPNQTIESLANDILFFKEIDADMIGIGPFIPHPQTPLSNENGGDFNLTLKMVALTRLNLPYANIPATTALETIFPNGKLIALRSGANVIMPNLTPLDCMTKYEIYPNKSNPDKDAQEYRENLKKEIKSIGLNISTDYGFKTKL